MESPLTWGEEYMHITYRRLPAFFHWLGSHKWQPDVNLLAGAGIFTAISDQTERNKTLKYLELDFLKEMIQLVILTVNEPLSCTPNHTQHFNAPLLNIADNQELPGIWGKYLP